MFENSSSLVRKNGTFFEALSKKCARKTRRKAEKGAEKKRWKSSFATFQFAAIKTHKKSLFLQKCSKAVRLLFGKSVLFSKRFRRSVKENSKKTRKRSRKKTLEILVSNIPIFGD
ncbi:hypothetical protein DTW91_12400 [Chryseobacterium sp. SC28]|nr:hypothetical protein DTW91_12400 [Chryseobacterium sp. SC28]